MLVEPWSFALQDFRTGVHRQIPPKARAYQVCKFRLKSIFFDELRKVELSASTPVTLCVAASHLNNATLHLDRDVGRLCLAEGAG